FVLMSDEKAKSLGKEPLATIVAHEAVGVEAKDFPETPGIVINELVKKAGKTVDEIDVFEINEAFAAVSLIILEVAGIERGKVNVNGDAVSLGQATGACGVSITLLMINEV